MSENEGRDRANARGNARKARRAKAEKAAPAPAPRNVDRRASAANEEWQARKAEGRPSDREAVLAVNAMFYRAFEVRDLDAMGEVWSREPYVRCIHPGWEPLVGWDEVIGSWQQIFAGIDRLQFELADVSVRMGGAMAWVEVSEKLEAVHAGKPARSTVLATNIFERREDGSWRMIHHHASPVMVRQPMPTKSGSSIH